MLESHKISSVLEFEDANKENFDTELYQIVQAYQNTYPNDNEFS